MAENDFSTCPHCGKKLFVPFNQTAPLINQPKTKDDSWRVLLAAASLTFAGVYFVTWWDGYSPVWAALAATGVGVGLPVLKTVLHTPARPGQAGAQPRERHIKVTMTTPLPNGNKVQLDQTFGVPEHTLVWVARRLVDDGVSFSRRNLCRRGKCSQGQFEDVQAVLIKNHWAVWKDPQTPTLGCVINRHGMAVFRAILRDYNTKPRGLFSG